MRTNKKNIAEELTVFLKQLTAKNFKSSVLKRQASDLITQITADDFLQAEQNLQKTGLSGRKIQELSASFIMMGVLKGTHNNLRDTLPDTHILRKIIAEHDILRCFIADLRDISIKINKAHDLTDRSSEFMRLCHVVEHLYAMDEHCDRENDVIFPCLKKKGWKKLCKSIESDHLYLRIAVNDLVKITRNFNQIPLNVFKTRLASLVKYFSPAIREHLFQEENILFPLALTLIDDPEIWKGIKETSEELGYCGIHL